MRFEFPLRAYTRVLTAMEEHPRIQEPQIQVATIPPRSGYLELDIQASGFIVFDRQRIPIYAGDGGIDTNYLVDAGPAFSLAEKIAAENGVELVEADSAGHGDFCVSLPSDATKGQIRYALDRMVATVVSYVSQVQALDLCRGGRSKEDDIHVGK